jgi:5-formyltetrahydrofolate cyclo-ligase
MRDATPAESDKHDLRLRMREARRELPDRAERSEQIRDRLVSMNELVQGQRVLLFATIPGEPEMAPFRTWCEEEGKATSVPEDNVVPAWPDVVIVPGLAFTVDGDRLGQGGGWYDRFLSNTRAGCTTIGVGFDMQVVGSLPTEPHDIALDYVVTDRRVVPIR